MGAAQPGGDAEAPEGPTVESWSEKDQRIIVSQPADGFLYDLVLRAKIDADPADVYDVLVYPNSHEVFRGIKATLSRTTLEDDGRGRRKLRVGHRALTKFLWISVTFDTELFVWEDDVARTIRFTNARSDGFMAKFDGTWRVQPFTQHTLDGIYRTPGQHQQQQQQHRGGGRHHWMDSLAHAAVASGSSRRHQHQQPGPASTLVTLEQALAPKVKPPGPVAHLVRGLCGRVLNNMMEDLRKEVARRHELEADGSSSSSAGGGRGGAGKLSFFGQQQQTRQSSSLPVASLSLSSSSMASSRDGGGTRSSWRSSWRGCGTADDEWASEGRSSSSIGGGLQDLLSAAMPLHITIRL